MFIKILIMRKIFENRILQGVLTGVLTALSLTMLWLMIDVRDFVKYKQPQRDEKQDIRTDELKKYYNQICQLIARLNSNKLEKMNKRIDNYKDDIRRIEEKIDKLLLTKYMAEK